MPVIEKVLVGSEAMRVLERQARLDGVSTAQAAARILERRLGQATADRSSLIARSRALRATAGPQTTDSFDLLREDRDR